MKKAYKDLRKNLKNSFYKLPGNEYSIVGNIEEWVKQHCGKCTKKHFKIVCEIHKSIFYPYQEADRKKILKYLKTNKYKSFKTL